tara:strand:+ start:2427 stop:2924 length:498 start_codon:yes stop_codon:yes gene_type:complete
MFVRSSNVAPDTPGELDILGHDSHALGVNGAEVAILEETDHVRLSRFLEGEDSGGLEPEAGLEVLCDLSHQALERLHADQEFPAFLVLADLTKSDGTGSVAVRLLDATCGGRLGDDPILAVPLSMGSAFASSFGSELVARSLTPGGLACGLLGSCHGNVPPRGEY